MVGADHRPGSHPVDHLVQELVRTGRAATADEVERIGERIATATFGPSEVRVRPRERGLSYQGRALRTRDDSLFVHLVRRVVLERQWAAGTTADDYLADLRQAVRSPQRRLAIYLRRGGHLAATISPTLSGVPASRRGPEALPWLLVVYSADRGIIVSGYQISGSETAAIPEDARWLTP
jgi:hypothetical protein